MVGWKIPKIFFLHSIMRNAGIFKIFLLVDLEDESCIRCPILGLSVFALQFLNLRSSIVGFALVNIFLKNMLT